MTNEEMNIAVAEACGWRWDNESIWTPNGGKWARWHEAYSDGCEGTDRLNSVLPNYTSDLNAMYEAINTLPSDGRWHEYVETLKRLCYWDCGLPAVQMMLVINASARKRAEAFLRVHGKWEDTHASTPT